MVKTTVVKIPTRNRNYSITINNYTDEQIKNWLKIEGEYVFQEEKGAKGTPHLQGFHMFKSPKTFEQVKEIFPTAHIEVVRNIIAIKKYCSKEDTLAGKRYCNVTRWKIKEAVAPEKIPDRQALFDDEKLVNYIKYISWRDNTDENWGHLEYIQERYGDLYKASLIRLEKWGYLIGWGVE